MTSNELPPNERNIYIRAVSAFELRNYGLAVSLLAPLVAKRPEFLAGREFLRKAQIARSGNKGSILGGISLGRSKVGKLIESGDLDAALNEAEKALDANPSGVTENKDLFAAAEAIAKSGRSIVTDIHKKFGGNDKTDNAVWKKLNYIHGHVAAQTDAEMVKSVEDAVKKIKTFEAIAGFALKTLINADPKNAKAKHEYGDYLVRTEEYDQAVVYFEGMIGKDPDALAKAKEAAARRSMKGQGKTFADDRKKKEQEAKESGERSADTEESPEELEQKVQEAYEAGSSDAESARKLASIYFNQQNYERSLDYYIYLSALANDTDPGLLRKISDCEVRVIDKNIAEQQNALNSLATDDSAAATIQATIEDLKRQKAEKMLGEARKRVDRNPTDLQYRFELGEQMVLAGHYKEAIPELQKARSNPNTRTKALNLLGKCYTERNMLDLAAKTLTDAASEIPGMDGTKKDILYNLGLVYERMGNMQKSLDCMKQIYGDDYDYRDVARRVEDSYTTPPSDPEDGSPGAGVPAKLSPTTPPLEGSAAKKLPPDEEENA